MECPKGRVGRGGQRTQKGHPRWEQQGPSLQQGASDQGVKVGHMLWARGTLLPPLILWGTFLCFRQGEGSKDLQDALEGCGMPRRRLLHTPPVSGP